MHFTPYLSAILYGLPILAQKTSPWSVPEVDDDHFKVYMIQVENITAKFIAFGARLISLLVPDRDGNVQDVVVGYDDPMEYLHSVETAHTYFGPVVGRYANRIKNSTFTIDGETSHIPANDHDGKDTLHGGKIGYDQRNWTVTDYGVDTVTFTLFDKAWQGFPGDVLTHATYSVNTERSADNPDGLPQLTTKLVSLALTEETPIMLSNHIYWNLNGFQNMTILDDTFLQLPLSPRYVATDPILIPNGTIAECADAYNGSPDFTGGKLVGADINETAGLCGAGCVGYDNCFIVDRPPAYAASDSMVPAVRMNSSTTGISLECTTNQQAIQIYACNGLNGTIPVKPSQRKRNGGDGPEFINKHACVVIETEGWIDGVNHPEWGQMHDQVFSPRSPPAVNYATYTFGIVHIN